MLGCDSFQQSAELCVRLGFQVIRPQEYARIFRTVVVLALREPDTLGLNQFRTTPQLLLQIRTTLIAR